MLDMDNVEYIVLYVDENDYLVKFVKFTNLTEATSFYNSFDIPLLIGKHEIDAYEEIENTTSVPIIDEAIGFSPIFVMMANSNIISTDEKCVNIDLNACKKFCTDLRGKWLVGVTYSPKLDTLIQISINNNLLRE